MITRPKQSTFYLGRTDDCISAIEARFSQLISSQSGTFIDREAIAATLRNEGTRAGWAQHEVDDAVSALTTQYNMAIVTKPLP